MKQKACKPALWPVLTGHAKWEPLELPELTQAVNLKQYRILGGQKEITALINDMLEAGMLVLTNLLYNSRCSL